MTPSARVHESVDGIPEHLQSPVAPNVLREREQIIKELFESPQSCVHGPRRRETTDR